MVIPSVANKQPNNTQPTKQLPDHSASPDFCLTVDSDSSGQEPPHTYLFCSQKSSFEYNSNISKVKFIDIHASYSILK